MSFLSCPLPTWKLYAFPRCLLHHLLFTDHLLHQGSYSLYSYVSCLSRSPINTPLNFIKQKRRFMTNRIAASRAKSIFHSKISHVSDFSLLNPKKFIEGRPAKLNALHTPSTIRRSQGLENKMRLVILIDQVVYFSASWFQYLNGNGAK